MKNTMRLLKAALIMIDANWFYAITVRDYGSVELQGNFNTNLVRRLVALKFEFKPVGESTCGHIIATRGRITVILT
jgi:hypothetical protein